MSLKKLLADAATLSLGGPGGGQKGHTTPKTKGEAQAALDDANAKNEVQAMKNGKDKTNKSFDASTAAHQLTKTVALKSKSGEAAFDASGRAVDNAHGAATDLKGLKSYKGEYAGTKSGVVAGGHERAAGRHDEAAAAHEAAAPKAVEKGKPKLAQAHLNAAAAHKHASLLHKDAASHHRTIQKVKDATPYT